MTKWRRLRVWVVTPELHRQGAAERCIAEQVDRWRDRFELSVYTMAVEDVSLDNVRVRQLWRPRGPLVTRYVWWIAANHLVRRWDRLRLGPPDVVYSPGVNSFDADAISVHILFARYWEQVRGKAIEDLRKAARALRTLHRVLYWTFVRSLEQRVYNGPAALWTLSNSHARHLESRFGRPLRTVNVVPYGVSASQFSAEVRENRRVDAHRRLGLSDERVLLLVGNDWANKGLWTALRALAQLPRQYVLAVAGRDDPAPFVDLARRLEVANRLRFWPLSADMMAYYAAADCLVAPSREDSFSLPPLEALACGLPAIVSRRAGVSELLEHNRHALVLEDPDAAEDLAKLIARVFEEPGLAARMRREGLALAHALSWEANAERTADLIEREAATPRVLVLAPNPWGTGGIERATRRLLDSLAELYGPERVGLLAVWGPGDVADRLPARLVYAGWGRPSGKAGPRVGLLRASWFALSSFSAARRWRRRLVIVATHAHLAPIAQACGFVSGARYAVWAHGAETWGPLRPTVRRALRSAGAIFAPSHFTAESLTRACNPYTPHVRIVPHALSAGVTEPGDDSGGALAAPRVLAVARLHRVDAYKGVDTLLLAWPNVVRRLPDAELVVVGDGDDRPRLERLATRLGLNGRVRFRGLMDDNGVAQAYVGARVFALPGRARLGRKPEGEGFGLVFLEAAAAGLPCVAGRAGGAVEAVEHEVTGLLVDPEEPQQVGFAFGRFLQDPALARRMGEAGRARIAREFRYEQFRDRIDVLVRELAVL